MSYDSDDLFVRLINHRLYENRNRQEDFLTECLAWLLQQDEDLCRRLFVDDGRPRGLAEGVTVEHGSLEGGVQVETQQFLGPAGRPDLLVRIGEVVFLVEAKLDAPYERRQLERYLAHAGATRGFVVGLAPEWKVS